MPPVLRPLLKVGYCTLAVRPRQRTEQALVLEVARVAPQASLTSGTMMTVGDLVCQSIQQAHRPPGKAPRCESLWRHASEQLCRARSSLPEAAHFPSFGQRRTLLYVYALCLLAGTTGSVPRGLALWGSLYTARSSSLGSVF